MDISRIKLRLEQSKHIRELPGFLFLLALAGSLWLGEPRFANPTNLLTVAREMSIFGIMGAGMTMVILMGGIDLSVASVLAFSAAVMAKMLVAGASTWQAVPTALIIGAVCGAINGLLITHMHIPPIITTLGTMGILRAGVTLYTEAKWIGPLPQDFYFIGTGYTPLAILLATTSLTVGLLLWTRPGRYIHAIGGNESAVRLAGVNVERVKLAVYSANGLLAAMAGLIIASSMSSAQSNMAMGYELNVIAAVVIGGTSISGGRGSVFGTIIGAAIMAVTSNALTLLGIQVYWHKVIVGVIILTAVMADKLRQNDGSHIKG